MLGKALCPPSVLDSRHGQPEGFSVHQSARALILPQTQPHESFTLLT